MFSKLFKYDFRSVKRIGLPVLLIGWGVIALSTAGMALFSWMLGAFHGEFELAMASIGLVLTMMMGVMVLYGVAFAIPIAIYVDFYKTLITDQGYLTFTLPVKASHILLSKLLNGFIWTVLSMLTSYGGFLGIVFGAGLGFGGAEEMGSMLEGMYLVFTLGGEEGIFSSILMFLLAIVYMVNSLLLIFMAIFFGSVIAKKNKLFAAVGCVFGVNFIYSMVVSVAMIMILVFSSAIGAVVDNMSVVLNLSLGIGTVLLAGLCVLFYFLTKHMMERKLNLA